MTKQTSCRGHYVASAAALLGERSRARRGDVKFSSTFGRAVNNRRGRCLFAPRGFRRELASLGFPNPGRPIASDARRSALVVENGRHKLVGRDDVQQSVHKPLDGQVAPLGFLAEIRQHRAAKLELKRERRRPRGARGRRLDARAAQAVRLLECRPSCGPTVAGSDNTQHA